MKGDYGEKSETDGKCTVTSGPSAREADKQKVTIEKRLDKSGKLSR